MATRIQGKSRTAKKVMGTVNYDTYTGLADTFVGRNPRTDKRGYPAYKGLPSPVLVGVTLTDSTP